MPTCSNPRTAAQIPTSTSSTGVRGATKASLSSGVVWSGIGNARRSTLPLGVRGAAIRQIARWVAVFIWARPGFGAEGGRNDPFSGNLWTIEIAAGQASTADVYLPRDPDRNKLQVLVKYVGLQIRHRTTNNT